MRPSINELMLATNCEKWPERWNEIYGYEFLQREEEWLKNGVLPKLAAAKAASVGTLEREKIEIWRDQVVVLDLKCGKTPHFMDENMASELCKAVFAEWISFRRGIGRR